MKAITFFIVPLCLFATSCTDTAMNASVDIGRPVRVNHARKGADGYGFEVIYDKKGREKVRHLLKKPGDDGQPRHSRLVTGLPAGAPVPFSTSPQNGDEKLRSPDGNYPHVLVKEFHNGGIHRLVILDSKGEQIELLPPGEVPNWAARILLTPVGIVGDVALSPLYLIGWIAFATSDYVRGG